MRLWGAKGEDGLASRGWTRVTYLLFALTILVALAQARGPSADPRPLASKTPGGAAAEENQPVAEDEAERTALADGNEGDHPSTAIVGGDAGAGGSDPPVFYRPAPANAATDSQGAGADSGPVCADLGGFPSNRQIAFPLPREYVNSYEDTWGAPRPQGGHEGTDLMVPTGTAEYAITDGTIVAVDGANENGWNTLGGYTVMLRAAYSVGPIKHGDLFYYAHLDRESALEIGTKVRVGQTIGYAGNTGQGPEVTRGLFPPHLHFGWYDATGTRSTATSGAMNPYPLLEWIEANGGAITGGSDARYCESPRTGGPVPSAGASRWPAPRTPGVSPDLGSNAPSAETHEPQIDRASGAAPTGQQPSPTESPRPTPGGAAQQTHPQTPVSPSSQPQNPQRAGPPAGESAPQEEPARAPAVGSSQDHPDTPATDTDANETTEGPAGDNPDEHADQGSGEDAPQAGGEEPEDKGSEDGSQAGSRADDQDSPGEDQYTPENGTFEAYDDPKVTRGRVAAAAAR